MRSVTRSQSSRCRKHTGLHALPAPRPGKIHCSPLTQYKCRSRAAVARAEVVPAEVVATATEVVAVRWAAAAAAAVVVKSCAVHNRYSHDHTRSRCPSCQPHHPGSSRCSPTRRSGPSKFVAAAAAVAAPRTAAAVAASAARMEAAAMVAKMATVDAAAVAAELMTAAAVAAAETAAAAAAVADSAAAPANAGRNRCSRFPGCSPRTRSPSRRRRCVQ